MSGFLPTPKPTYILADVHLLPDSQHPINQAFVHFLNQQACYSQQLFIIGDLFESWSGDDVCIPLYQSEIDAIKHLTQQGIKVFIGYGNRDFLMRKAFWQASGAEWIDDEQVVEIQGQHYILLHGDSLCTDDKAYQRMRKFFRSKWFQWLFLKLPARKRLAIAQNLRQQSQQAGQNKPFKYMDINPQALKACFARHPQAQHLVHGHTHRPGHFEIEPNQPTQPKLQQWVVGDWRPGAQILKIEHGQPQLIEFKVY
ncbi:MAG: UDP-2,3-diacylglucosamine diphosphatase [Thiomicrospira sp.]